MFPDLSLLGCDAISNARVEYPQGRKGIGHGGGRGFDFNLAAPIREFVQGTRYVKGHRHDHFLVGRDLWVEVRRDLLVTDFVRDGVKSAAFGELAGELTGPCS